MSGGDKCYEESKAGHGTEMQLRWVRNGFSVQVTLGQRPECSDGMNHENNWRVSLAGPGKCKCLEVSARWDLRFWNKMERSLG